MLKIWGRKTSVNVQKVMWAVAELGTPYERGHPDGVLGHASDAAIVSLNPNRLVPVIDDGGFVLWESNAIVRYLASRYGSGACLGQIPDYQPSAAQAARDFASADRWMDWSITTLYPDIISTLFLQFVRVKADERKSDLVAIAAERAGKNLKTLEALLPHDGFITGIVPVPTIADIAVGTLLYRYFTLPIVRPSLPKVEAYYQRLTTRKAYQDHVIIDWQHMKIAGA